MINARLDSPAARTMARHAAQTYLANIYLHAGLPVPIPMLSDLVAAQAKRPAATLLYRIVPAKSATARPRPPKVERARAQLMEMRARAACVEMGVLRTRLAQ